MRHHFLVPVEAQFWLPGKEFFLIVLAFTYKTNST